MKSTNKEIVHHFKKLSNFRDIGGLKTMDGYTLKTGRLFRSDELSRMTNQDLNKLQAFNIKLICDLRSPDESREKQPHATLSKSIQIVNIPLHEDTTQNDSQKILLNFLYSKTGDDQFREFSRRYYHHIAFDQTSRIREVITLLSKEKNLPALIHCTAGKDRTGYLAAMIQLFVGVPYEMVMKDYLLTNDYCKLRLEKLIKVMRVITLFRVSSERIRLVLMAHPEFLHEVHEKIINKYGSIEKYLCEACEIDQSTLQKLKNQLLA